MDHLQQSRLNLLTSHMLDRGSLLRFDPESLGLRAADSRARFIGIHRMQIAVDRMARETPAWLTRDQALERFGHCEPWVYLGEEDETLYFALLLDEVPDVAFEDFAGLRALAFRIEPAQATLLAYAQALVAWHKRHRYCGRCGGPTAIAQGGHVRVCESGACGTVHYPRTDPAIIVLVESGERALFGRKAEWPKHRYSTIAGFVEPGESAEQALVREVAEETGVEVIAAHYHSSQPWPFPGSLMLGYHAQAGRDIISLNDQELEDARWLSRDEVSVLLQQGLFIPPPSISISFRLIEDWFNRASSIPLKTVIENSGAADF